MGRAQRNPSTSNPASPDGFRFALPILHTTLSEHVDRRETRLAGDAIPQVNRKTDVAGPKRIPSAANGHLSPAILDDGRHRELPCAIEPYRVVGAAVEL